MFRLSKKPGVQIAFLCQGSVWRNDATRNGRSNYEMSIISHRKYVTGARPVSHLRLIGSYDGHLNWPSNYYRIGLPCICMVPYGLPRMSQLPPKEWCGLYNLHGFIYFANKVIRQSHRDTARMPISLVDELYYPAIKADSLSIDITDVFDWLQIWSIVRSILGYPGTSRTIWNIRSLILKYS